MKAYGRKNGSSSIVVLEVMLTRITELKINWLSSLTNKNRPLKVQNIKALMVIQAYLVLVNIWRGPEQIMVWVRQYETSASTFLSKRVLFS